MKKSKRSLFNFLFIWCNFLNESFYIIVFRLNESTAGWRWQLQPSGRFAHNKVYVTSVGDTHGLKTVHYEDMEGFRKEGQNDVRGHIFIMRKQAGPGNEL
jgi:predicted TPR repeat methyltransferase